MSHEVVEEIHGKTRRWKMEGIRFIDIYATKGIEYLIVISFLAAFVLFCRYMYQPREGRRPRGSNLRA